MAGRRSKRTDERREVILTTLRTGGTMREAAALTDMDTTTVYRWMQADATFRIAVARAEAQAEQRFRAVVVAKALGSPAQYDDAGNVIRAEVVADPAFAQWWLERRRRADYAQRVSVDMQALVARIAAEDGLDPEEVMAEVNDILGRSSR